jgi:oxygen-independent coproporphyrinogen III oxidase
MAAGIYLHIPFCRSRCSYCDFATDVWRSNDAVERYVNALSGEIAAFQTRQAIDTIYFGGGTPSLLTPGQFERIGCTLSSKFVFESDVEVTMEMNPATVTTETLAAYRSLGINRASFGVQTFDDRALKLLARGHDAADARETFRSLREAGYDNISFDLIAGLPGQTLDQWKRNLDEAIAMAPEHMSLYLLEIHEGTPLAEQVRSGRQPLPDAEIAAQMYEIMLDRLGTAGYQQYEISNFALPGHASRHNSKYWTLDPVYGFGVSAHSFDGRERYANERDTAKYVEMIESGRSAEVMREKIDRASEYVFLGLRMENGIDLSEYKTRFSIDLLEINGSEIDGLIDSGLVSIIDDRLRLTARGKLYSNEVFSTFV